MRTTDGRTATGTVHGVPVTSDPDLLIIHGLRVATRPTDTRELAQAVGLAPAVVDTRMADLARTGYVTHRDGNMAGWVHTPEGRAHGEARVAEELDAAGEREAVADLYQRFLGVNQGFLSLCTDWQLREVDGEQVLNDHADASHDDAVVARLVEADVVVQSICVQLAERLARFDGYGRRFSDALGRVQAGEVEWFTRPMIDSYHTVWFELHEDLLATLGIDRAKEGEQA